MRHLATFTVFTFVVWVSALAGAQDEHRQILRDKFQSGLEEITGAYEGVAGLHIIDLTDGSRFAVSDELVFPQASAIKVPILLELFRRAEAEPGLLSKRIEMTDKVRTAGSGVLQILTDGGSALSVEDYAIYMIVYSDNTATNVLIDELGMDAVNALSASLGAANTKLQRKMIRPEDSVVGNENLSTPSDGALIMEEIATCDLPMSKASCGRVREILGDLQRWSGASSGASADPDRVQAGRNHRCRDRVGSGRPARPAVWALGDVQLWREWRGGHRSHLRVGVRVFLQAERCHGVRHPRPACCQAAARAPRLTWGEESSDERERTASRRRCASIKRSGRDPRCSRRFSSRG